MSLDPVRNFARVTVSTGYDESATEIVLASGHGSRLPLPSSDGAFNLVWWNSSDYPSPTDDPNREIVRVTGRSDDTLTVIRGQEGTSATTKNTSGKTYMMLLTITKKTVDDVRANYMATGERGNYFYTSANTFANSTHSHGNPQLNLTNLSGTTASNSGGLTLSLSANGEHNWHLLSGNVVGTTTASGNSIRLVGGNNVTLSGRDGSVVEVMAGNIGQLTYPFWAHPEGMWTSLGTTAQGSLSIKHFYCPQHVSGTVLKIGGSLSANTNTSATTASCNLSVHAGIYSLNGSTLSRITSGSANNGFQWSHSGSTTANTSIHSMREITVPLSVTLTPGSYWVGVVVTSATTYTNAVFTIYGNNLINNAASAAMLAPIGVGTAASSSMVIPYQGIYTAATAGLPDAIVKSDINWSSASNLQRANFWHAMQGVTY